MKKIIKHVIKEGSREHVTWWDSDGEHCTCENCEINFRGSGVKIHYEQTDLYTLCGIKISGKIMVTSEVKKVTCLHCLRILKKI